MNEQAMKALEELAKQFNTTGQYLWGILVHQALVSGVLSLVWVAIATVVTVKSIRTVKRAYSPATIDGVQYNTLQETFNEDGEVFVNIVIPALLIPIFFIVFCCALDNAITGLLNPEYWALDEMLSAIKGQ